MDKILIVRMLDISEIVNITVPAVRYFKQKFPDAEIHVLTYGKGATLINLAEPEVKVISLPEGQWPDNILLAMESFLGLAEDIIGYNFGRIVNLDTSFMPCFLARFLKDAGEPVEGNYLAKSVQELIDGIQGQTLQTEFVHDCGQYMLSSYFGMSRWHSEWWKSEEQFDYGYAEFYLKRCCGYLDLQMDMSIDVVVDEKFKVLGQGSKVIAVSLEQFNRECPNPVQLKKHLQEMGFVVWIYDPQQSIKRTLSMLRASDLLVTVPSATQWLATAVDCPSLMVSMDIDHRILMPEYATEPSSQPISAKDLADSIQSIFSETTDE